MLYSTSGRLSQGTRKEILPHRAWRFSEHPLGKQVNLRSEVLYQPLPEDSTFASEKQGDHPSQARREETQLKADDDVATRREAD